MRRNVARVILKVLPLCIGMVIVGLAIHTGLPFSSAWLLGLLAAWPVATARINAAHQR